MATTYNDAGRILLISKGTFATKTAYSSMDYVYYSGSTYVCKSAVESSNTTTPDKDTTHWQLLASGIDATEFNNVKSAVDNMWTVVHTW